MVCKRAGRERVHETAQPSWMAGTHSLRQPDSYGTQNTTKLGLVNGQLLSQLKKSGWKVYFYQFNYYIVNILNIETLNQYLCSLQNFPPSSVLAREQAVKSKCQKVWVLIKYINKQNS